MELTLNINVSERFCEAVELLAAAISKSNEMPFIGNMKPNVATPVGNVATSVDNVATSAPLEKLKKELDLEVVEEVTVTADILRDKMQAILQKNPNYALNVKGALKGLGAERISDLDEKKYLDFYNMLSDIEKEVSA